MGTEGSILLERGCIQRFDRDGNVIEKLSREYSWPSAAYSQLEYLYDILRKEKTCWVDKLDQHIGHALFIEKAYQSLKIGVCK